MVDRQPLDKAAVLQAVEAQLQAWHGTFGCRHAGWALLRRWSVWLSAIAVRWQQVCYALAVDLHEAALDAALDVLEAQQELHIVEVAHFHVSFAAACKQSITSGSW